jgi:ATP-dependent DNA helicase PIF1
LSSRKERLWCESSKSGDPHKLHLSCVFQGQNLFFTGGAGTGKSFLLKTITRYLPRATCFITASTGIAASLIGGVTVHSFAGISANDLALPIDKIVAKIQNSKRKMDNWRKVRHLVIDEISMIDGDFFDTLEEIARYF